MIIFLTTNDLQKFLTALPASINMAIFTGVSQESALGNRSHPFGLVCVAEAEDKQNSRKSKCTQRICPFSLLQCLRHVPTDDIFRDRKGEARLFVGMDWWEENSEGWWINELYICAVILLFLLHLCFFLYQLEALRQRSELSWNCHVWSIVKWHAGTGPSVTHEAPLSLNGVDKPCSSCLHANKCQQVRRCF